MSEWPQPSPRDTGGGKAEEEPRGPPLLFGVGLIGREQKEGLRAGQHQHQLLLQEQIGQKKSGFFNHSPPRATVPSAGGKSSKAVQ